MKRAFTLIEMLSVIAIIGLVATITYPALFSAMTSAKIGRSVENLHQLHVAHELYRADDPQGGLTTVGYPPNGLKTLIQLKLVSNAQIHTGGRWILDGIPNSDVYAQLYPVIDSPTSDVNLWLSTLSERGESLPFLLDLTFNDSDHSNQDLLRSKFGVAVYMDGSIHRQRRRGDLTQFRNWK
jgi:prepilin-type N-terminal cleavage/methylation domain-containing protein